MIDNKKIYEDILIELSMSMPKFTSNYKLKCDIKKLVKRVLYANLYNELLSGKLFPEIEIEIDFESYKIRWVRINIKKILDVDIMLRVYSNMIVSL
jgi:hypothetical protein